MGLRIIEEGLLTTIQDIGRYGYQSLGFSINGAIDQWAMRLANILLENDENDAVLEMSFIGPSITFKSAMIIALTGADMSPKINDKSVALTKPLAVQAGDTLQLRTAKTGIHCYLAVKGGLNIPEVLHSKSTSLKANIGGIEGRKVQVGDLIQINTPLQTEPIPWGLSPKLFDYIHTDQTVIHFIEGRQYNWFTNHSLQKLESDAFHTTTKSDRMGYRLIGPRLELQKVHNMISEATTFGTIQVPPNGQPIVLMADRQPTGGYPKIGQVIQADLPKLSQLRPSQPFLFQKCSLDEAYHRLYQMEQELTYIKAATHLKWREWE